MTYTIGDAVPLTYTLSAAATVTLTITAPDGTTSNPILTQGGSPPAVTYTSAFLATQAGVWRYRFDATGAITDAEEGHVAVEPAVAGDVYATVRELRDEMGDTANNLPHGLLAKAAWAASRAIDDYTGRRFWLDPVATTRIYRPAAWDTAAVDDIGSTTGLIVKTDTGGDGSFATTLTLGSDYQLEPLNAHVNGSAYAWNRVVLLGGSFPMLGTNRPTLQVIARHGWSQHPAPVREGAILKGIRLFKRREAPFSIDTGFAEFGPVRITRSDADVVALLDPYVLDAVA